MRPTPSPRPPGPLRRLAVATAALSAAALLLTNVMVWNQARSMVTLVEGAPPPGDPLRLSTGEKLRLVWSGATLPKPRAPRTAAEAELDAVPVELQPLGGPKLWAEHVRTPAPKGTLVLLHGYLGTGAQLHELAAWAAAQGWDSLLIDQRAHGRSAGTQTSIGRLEAWDAAAGVEWAQQRPGPVVVYGFSMGAAAAIGGAARAGARPQALILEGVYARMTEAVAWRVELMGLPSGLLSPWLCAAGSLVLQTNMLAQAPEDDAAQVSIPTLLLHGEDDTRAPPSAGARLRARLRGPAALVVLPDTGHQVGLRSAPAPWTEAVGRTLAQAAADPEAPGP
jgi:alpha-beta hydrolase superfamily lysophospholipase